MRWPRWYSSVIHEVRDMVCSLKFGCTVGVMVALTVVLAATGAGGCDTPTTDTPVVTAAPPSDTVCFAAGTSQTLRASWYARGQYVDGWTFRGLYDTCASNVYERGTWLVLTYRDKRTLAYVNDYGPDPAVHPDRQLDLSGAVAKRLGLLNVGVADVVAREVMP